MSIKRIQILDYPAAFSFKVRTPLPSFKKRGYVRTLTLVEGLLDKHQYIRDIAAECARQGLDSVKIFSDEGPHVYSCEVRRKLLLWYLTKLKVPSPCHAHADYTIENIIYTLDGEVWELGS